MDVAALLIVILLVGLAVVFVAQPLRRGALIRVHEADEGRIADLRAARLAKYGEIRDAEMDYRTGKLSEADWRTLDRQLRAEAVDILHELDTLTPGEPDDLEAPPPAPAVPEHDDDPVATIAER